MDRGEMEKAIIELAPYVSDSVLAKAFGTTKAVVRWIRRKHGVLKQNPATRKYNSEGDLLMLKNRIIELESRGLRGREIWESLGLTYNKYSYLRRILGLRSRHMRKLNIPELVEKFKKFIEKKNGNYTLTEAAKHLGVCYSTVRKLAKTYNLPPPNRPPPRKIYNLTPEELRRGISILVDMYNQARLSYVEAAIVKKLIVFLEALSKKTDRRQGLEPHGIENKSTAQLTHKENS
jgi:hypothetical protein